MSDPSSVVSQTLQAINATKVKELEKQTKIFQEHKVKILEAADKAPDCLSRLEILLSGIDWLGDYSEQGNEKLRLDTQTFRYNAFRVEHFRQYLEQARYDPSISPELLESFEKIIRDCYTQQDRRFDFANLYSKLLAEWSDQSAGPIAEISDTDSLDGSFELVERDRLQKLRDKFTSVAFTPRLTDEVEIDNYMQSLFADDLAAASLWDVRSTVRLFGKHMWNMVSPFHERELEWCISGLLANDLLNDQQKRTLEEFRTNDVASKEIIDVLNIRCADLENWSWDAPNGMYYEPRRQLNGKYRIMMDHEDLIQAIFLHYIAVRWCVMFKDTFRSLVDNSRFWKVQVAMTKEELDRYSFCFGPLTPAPKMPLGLQPPFGTSAPKPKIPLGLQNLRHPLAAPLQKPSISTVSIDPTRGMSYKKRETFKNDYFMSSMPSTVHEGAGAYNDDDRRSKNSGKSALDIRQQLLRQLATDIVIHKSLYGEAAVIQSDLQWFASGLPHSTITALLRFWGVPENWIRFFKKFAEAPLRMSDAPGAEVRIRRRGIPITDAFEKLFGELTLFAMDVAINRESGMNLYRMHDDLWIWGNPAQCTVAWKSMECFVKTLGLDINLSKTGSAYLSSDTMPKKTAPPGLPSGDVSIGLLKLSESGAFVIDQAQVDAHVKQLRKQLGACTSIVAWIQTWNSCIGKFFQHTFGTPANCFGQIHVENILKAHQKIQKDLFGDVPGGSVTSYLRLLIKERIGFADVPDCFFHMPEELGGLGLRNPFVSFIAVRQWIIKNPDKVMTDFLLKERSIYEKAKKQFDALTEHERRRRYKAIYDDDLHTAPSSARDFMSFAEFTKHREVHSPELREAYETLMRVPDGVGLASSRKVASALAGMEEVWDEMDLERSCLVQMYSEELFGLFGALSIVERSLLPLGVMTLLRDKRATWQMVL
ncbi:hypothetical protein K402DRAFT_396031 [Aulographum hederae CBS 113979]|uniref:Reverse transcriptase domain-containing protein n=1 Tax=Aulographum hederae CBS 113979 TaxID=1176131 RepID=A0A6G1GT01_9PEZI|nr:hypothetical protein K402DRAFT_396031 [Aulographum hederae CBS 113979]